MKKNIKAIMLLAALFFALSIVTQAQSLKALKEKAKKEAAKK